MDKSAISGAPLPVTVEARLIPTTGSRRRIDSLDALRGIVMILMALDHVRDLWHRGAMSFSPTDLTKTTTVLFLTRWVTHFCMPTFMFTAGISAFLWLHLGNHTKGDLAQFLLKRGAWFILLELTVMQFSYDFNFSTRNAVLLLVLWIFGLCMVAMAGLIWLPIRILAVVSLAIILLHNLLDRVALPVWLFLHQPGVFQFSGRTVLVSYPLIPWLAVMAAGFCFGTLLLTDRERRRNVTLRMGAALTAAFLILRSINIYGDPAPHTTGILSFLNCTKYPASLDYLLMTIGPALMAFSLLDRFSFSRRNPLIVFGRVPFFYFVLHFYLIHVLLVLMCWIHYGNAAFSFMFNPVPSFGGPANLFPHDFGFRLRTVYLVWLLVLALLYPLCLWFSGVKSRYKYAWLKYL